MKKNFFVKEKWKKGFTLAELLVVIFIITILSLTVTASYRQGQKIYSLQRSAQKLAADIRKIEEMAISTKSSACGKPDYGIYIGSVPTTSYILFADCNFNKDFDQEDLLIEKNNLEPTVEIRAISSMPLNLTFTPPDPTVNIPQDRNRAIIQISNETGDKKIIINKAGLIEIQ
jgi:prepilin-type N-terminal cleavage/methylation domain-containing protein